MQKNGISRLSVENFLSQSAGKFRWGTLRYIRKVRLSRNLMPKRVISFFSVEFLSRLLPINLAGNPSLIQDLWETEYCYAQYGGIAILRCFFGLPVLKHFVGITFNLTENFGYRIFLCMRTENHVLQSKIFVAQYAKIYWEPILSFRVLGISETFMHITVFLQFFCLTVPKNFVRNNLMFQKVSNVRYRKDL